MPHHYIRRVIQNDTKFILSFIYATYFLKYLALVVIHFDYIYSNCELHDIFIQLLGCSYSCVFNDYMVYHTVKNIGGKKFWQIWQIKAIRQVFINFYYLYNILYANGLQSA